MVLKLHNKLPNHLESLENVLPFRKNFCFYCKRQISIMENVNVYDDNDLF
jgi:hypothetical protein